MQLKALKKKNPITEGVKNMKKALPDMRLLQLAFDLSRYERGYVVHSGNRLTMRDRERDIYLLKEGVEISAARTALEDYKNRYAKEVETAQDNCCVMMSTVQCTYSDCASVKLGAYYSIPEFDALLNAIPRTGDKGKRIECVVKPSYNRTDIPIVKATLTEQDFQNGVIESLKLNSENTAEQLTSVISYIEDCRRTARLRLKKEKKLSERI